MLDGKAVPEGLGICHWNDLSQAGHFFVIPAPWGKTKYFKNRFNISTSFGLSVHRHSKGVDGGQGG